MSKSSILSPLFLEAKPLLDAKAVLLVYDDQRQMFEVHAFLEQRMSSHRDPDLSRSDSLQR
jgi:hypothetical protein